MTAHLSSPVRLRKSEAAAVFKKWHPTALMEWAKFGTGNARYDLARSGIPAVLSLEDIPGGPYVPDLWGANYSGHEGMKSTVAAMYHAQPENVLLAQGASECNFLMAGAILSAGGTAIVETPCYEPVLRSLEVWTDRIVFLPRRREERFQPDPDEFRRLLTPQTRLVMLTNLHNPSHVHLYPERRDEIIATAEDIGAVVMMDEVYLRMFEPDHSVHGFSHGAVSINSLGKTWGLDTLRVGWAVGPADIVHRAYRLNNLLGVNQPYLAEDLAWRILNSPEAVAWLTSRMRKAAAGRRGFDQFLKVTPEVSCVLPDAGINAFIELPEATDDAEFIQRLITERDTAVFPGHFFGTPGTVRISFGGEPEEVVEGLRRLTEAIRAL